MMYFYTPIRNNKTDMSIIKKEDYYGKEDENDGW